MKSKIAIGLISAAVAMSVNAGVAEKKAARSADENIAAEVTKTKAACGNANLEVAVSWDKVNTMMDANAEKIKAKRDEKKWIIAHTGDRTVKTLEALAKICKDDADYKEELGKLTKVVVNPKESYEDFKSAFALDGTVLTVSSGHYMSRSASDFIDRLKALY